MSGAPAEIERTESSEAPFEVASPDVPWVTVVDNDPVNLMHYVTHVFQKVFGWDRQKAERHMMEVHERGKSVRARESLEKAEFYVHELQKYTLHATMERDS